MDKPKLVVRADPTREREVRFAHPLNPSSEIHGFPLSRAAGLARVGLWFLRVPPGKESFIYHRHHGEEEFMYVLAGRAMVEIDGVEHEVGGGDFVGFPAGTAHHLGNPFDEDVVYLSGGEARDLEVADFPKLGKRLIRVGEKVDWYAIDDAPLPFPGRQRL